MSRESALWSLMRREMGRGKHWLEATRHEDAINLGIADVSFVDVCGNHGWMELKDAAAWPARESTILRLDHYTEDQRAFLRRKGRAGGKAWLFVRVDRDYMLFGWREAQGVGRLNRAQLLECAAFYCLGGCDWAGLGRFLARF